MTTPADQVSPGAAPTQPAAPGDQAQPGKGGSAAIHKPAPAGSEPAKPQTPEPKAGDAPKDGAPGEDGKDGKPKGGAADAAPVAPETYTFSLPEGMELDKTLVDTVTPVFKEGNVSQATAQKLMDIHVAQLKAAEGRSAEAIKAHEAQQEQSFQATVNGWKEQATKELGANAAQELASAAKARDRFLSKESRELLEATGIGNHISLIRDFIKLGKSISEGRGPVEGPAAPVNAGEGAKSLFPSMQNP